MKVINVLTIQKQYHSLHEAAYLLASAKDHPLDKGDEGSWEETDLEVGILFFYSGAFAEAQGQPIGEE